MGYEGGAYFPKTIENTIVYYRGPLETLNVYPLEILTIRILPVQNTDYLPIIGLFEYLIIPLATYLLALGKLSTDRLLSLFNRPNGVRPIEIGRTAFSTVIRTLSDRITDRFRLYMHTYILYFICQYNVRFSLLY